MLFVDMKIYKTSQRSLICLSQVPPANSCHFLKSNKTFVTQTQPPVCSTNSDIHVATAEIPGEWLKRPEVRTKLE